MCLKAELREVVGRFHKDCLVPTEPSLSPWCGINHLSDEWLASNHEYSAKDIDFEVPLRRLRFSFASLLLSGIML